MGDPDRLLFAEDLGGFLGKPLLPGKTIADRKFNLFVVSHKHQRAKPVVPFCFTLLRQTAPLRSRLATQGYPPTYSLALLSAKSAEAQRAKADKLKAGERD